MIQKNLKAISNTIFYAQKQQQNDHQKPYWQ